MQQLSTAWLNGTFCQLHFRCCFSCFSVCICLWFHCLLFLCSFRPYLYSWRCHLPVMKSSGCSDMLTTSRRKVQMTSLISRETWKTGTWSHLSKFSCVLKMFCTLQTHSRVDLLHGGAQSSCQKIRPGDATILRPVSVWFRCCGAEWAGAGMSVSGALKLCTSNIKCTIRHLITDLQLYTKRTDRNI